MASGSPTLTVIVPVFNEEREIAETLRLVDARWRAARSRADVIVVDDGSTDGTAAAARAAGVSLRSSS